MPICLAESSLPYLISHSIKAPISDLEKIGVEKQIKHVFLHLLYNVLSVFSKVYSLKIIYYYS